MKKFWKVALVCAVSAAVLCGCGGGSSNSGGGSASSDTASEVKGDIVIGVKTDISSLNPHNHNDITSAYVTRSIYSNLIRLNEDNEFVGDLAESWEQVDPTTVSFKLKEGVKFSNGEPVTSEDVKYSLELQKDSAKVGHLVDIIDNVEVVDDTNFIIHMNAESNALISSLQHSGAAILCKSYCEELEANGKSLDDEPMGSGPYKFVEWVASASVTLEKNPDYFDADRMAQNDTITLKVIPEESARTIALETGEIDMLLDVGTADAQKIRDNADLALDEYEITTEEFFCMNTQKAPFDNVLVRQAMNYAIKKDDVLISAANGEGTIADNYFSPVALGYYDTAVKYEYDVDKAKALLEEAGYGDGFTFTVFVSNENRARSATVIQENLSQLGITMNIEQMESATFFERTGNGEHDACLTGWVPNAEPDNSYRPLFKSENVGSGGNRAFYVNEEVDKLVDAAAVSLDQDEIDAARSEVIRIISEDAIWVPLYNETGMIGRNKDLQGVVGSSIKYQDFYGIHY